MPICSGRMTSVDLAARKPLPMTTNEYRSSWYVLYGSLPLRTLTSLFRALRPTLWEKWHQVGLPSMGQGPS